MCLAIPGKIVKIYGVPPFLEGDVSFDGTVKKNISLIFCPDAKEENYVLVHAGNALAIVDEAEAKLVLEALETYHGEEI